MHQLSTRDRILDLAEELIMIRGYNAFSYHDIAPKLGIKTASIHYHFPKKTDLGEATVERYSERLSTVANALILDSDLDSWERLDAYLDRFMMVAAESIKVCLCGALGGEFGSLPQSIQSRVADFFDFHQQWLANLLAAGREQGEFVFSGKPEPLARMLFAALQGGIMVARAHDDSTLFKETVETIRELLR